MTLYISQHTVLQQFGAAGPYSALILAAPRTAIPYGAKRSIGMVQDVWSPTADNTFATGTNNVAYMNASTTVADLQVYSAAQANGVPDGMTHYVLWQKTVPAGPDPLYMLVSWEIWSQ